MKSKSDKPDKTESKNPLSGIYFTTNDVYRTVGLGFILIGQFTEKFSYEIFSQKFETSELTLVGVGIAIVFPLLMRKFSKDQGENQ